ncbi:hypothetical protein K443DRAFT_14999 [Laccaria amethystina LaAM-08-1]|uniref:Unplaced genomic scaffold K443scaffold_588, whole genome shotgun sequence n=1 Tax=Laccaria amethystina LaAM-08-1 TaxID=1095629 RepID=A0A0C9WRY7_9AGAR|nr:hypothetical protein K443DRAFT_14999 [Laccaria amethystina LaAM-08-1]
MCVVKTSCQVSSELMGTIRTIFDDEGYLTSGAGLRWGQLVGVRCEQKHIENPLVITATTTQRPSAHLKRCHWFRDEQQAGVNKIYRQRHPACVTADELGQDDK